MAYEWGDAFVTNDGHAWTLGVDVLNCPKTPTGEWVMLPARVPVGSKVPILVSCDIYEISTELFTDTSPIFNVYIAVGQHRHETVVFQDGFTFTIMVKYMNLYGGLQ